MMVKDASVCRGSEKGWRVEWVKHKVKLWVVNYFAGHCNDEFKVEHLTKLIELQSRKGES